MSQLKITSYASGATSLPDNPSDSGYTPEQIKKTLDSRTDNEIKQKHNALVDALKEHESASNPHGITLEALGHTDGVAAHEAKSNPHRITKDTLGLSDVDNTRDMDKPVSNPMKAYIQQVLDGIPSSGGGSVSSAVTSVAGRTGAVILDKSDVGLSNVDNTSDMDKPISNAVLSYMDAHMSAVNPHLVTKHDVGLSNVDNTSDAAKPVSNPTKAYIADAVPSIVESAVASMGAVKVETKTYTGTGATGTASPSSITFSGTPVLVLIAPEDFSATAYGGIIFGNKAHVWQTARSTDNKIYTLDASFSGNTVSWYSTATSNDSLSNSQMNVSGKVYRAIGFVL